MLLESEYAYYLCNLLQNLTYSIELKEIFFFLKTITINIRIILNNGKCACFYKMKVYLNLTKKKWPIVFWSHDKERNFHNWISGSL